MNGYGRNPQIVIRDRIRTMLGPLLAEHLRAFRSQADASRATGLTQDSVSRLLNGNNHYLSVEKYLGALAELGYKVRVAKVKDGLTITVKRKQP